MAGGRPPLPPAHHRHAAVPGGAGERDGGAGQGRRAGLQGGEQSRGVQVPQSREERFLKERVDLLDSFTLISDPCSFIR